MLDNSLDAKRNKRATRLLHAVLGLCTEIAEVKKAVRLEDVKNIMEEMGDIFWYLAIIDDEINVKDLPEVLKCPEVEYKSALDKPIDYWLGEIQDVVKRHLFYGESLEEENKKNIIPIDRLQLAYHGINYWLQEINRVGVHKQQRDYLVANIEKLSKRYPSLAFDKDNAVDRDVENELSHIVSNTSAHVPSDPLVTQEPIDKMLDEIDIELADNVRAGRQELKLTNPVATAESGLLGRTEFMLANTAPKVEAEELFSDENSHEIVTESSFNHFLRETYTTSDIEKLAMQLAFNTAAYYRGINALGIARAYDSLYSAYSGKGDKLEDYSCYIMWRDLGYPLSKIEIVNKICELRIL